MLTTDLDGEDEKDKGALDNLLAQLIAELGMDKKVSWRCACARACAHVCVCVYVCVYKKVSRRCMYTRVCTRRAGPSWERCGNWDQLGVGLAV